MARRLNSSSATDLRLPLVEFMPGARLSSCYSRRGAPFAQLRGAARGVADSARCRRCGAASGGADRRAAGARPVLRAGGAKTWALPVGAANYAVFAPPAEPLLMQCRLDMFLAVPAAKHEHCSTRKCRVHSCAGVVRWWKGARAEQRVDRRRSYASVGPGWEIQEVSRLGAQGVTSKSKLLPLICYDCAQPLGLRATLTESPLALAFQACCGHAAPRTAPPRGVPPPGTPRIRRWTTAGRSRGRFLCEKYRRFFLCKTRAEASGPISQRPAGRAGKVSQTDVATKRPGECRRIAEQRTAGRLGLM